MLIDTHILVWSFEGIPGNMGPETVALVKKEFNNCFVSMASFFEIKVKQRKGGLKQFSIVKMETDSRLRGIGILDIQLKHIVEIPGLNIAAHADPFDLILVAQAISEETPLLTCDQKILNIAHPGLRLIDGRK